MAIKRYLLAICLALILVMTYSSPSWADGPGTGGSTSDPADGGGESGHPWDDQVDGTTPPGDSTMVRTSAQDSSDDPLIMPGLSTGGDSFIRKSMLRLWRYVVNAKIGHKKMGLRRGH